MKQLYTLCATCAVFAAAALALHPTFLADGGIIQSLTPYLMGLLTGTFGMLASE